MPPGWGRTICDRAFAPTTLKSGVHPSGLRVLGFSARYVNARSVHQFDAAAADHFYPGLGSDTPYKPARMSREIENQRLALFVHDTEQFRMDENFLRACKELKEIYSYARCNYTYSFELCVELMLHSASSDASPGPEWTRLGYRSKKDCVEGCTLPNGKVLPSVLLIIKETVMHYIRGEFCWKLWGASLKDELVKLLKYIGGDTRLFFGGPIEHLLASMMVWGPVFDRMYENWRSQWTVAGFSPKYGQFAQLLSRFAGCSEIFNNDFKWYDTSERAPYLREIGNILSFLASDHPACFPLMEETIFTVLVSSRGDILQKEGGLPSGCFITLIANCLMDEALNRAAHLDNCGPDTDDHLIGAVVGDDNAIGKKSLCPLSSEGLTRSHASRGFTLKEVGVHKDTTDMRFCGLVFDGAKYLPREDKLICALVWPKASSPEDRLQVVGQIRDELVFSPRVCEVESWYRKLAQKANSTVRLRMRDRAIQIWTGSDQIITRPYALTLECLKWCDNGCT